MVDRGRAARYLEALDRLLADWRGLAGAPASRLEADRALAQRVCYVLLASIQTGLDLANLAIAERGLPRPDSYREAFEILERHGLLRSRRAAATLRELAGFRNLLVHHYVKLDWREVGRNLKRGLPALAALRKEAARWTR